VQGGAAAWAAGAAAGRQRSSLHPLSGCAPSHCASGVQPARPPPNAPGLIQPELLANGQVCVDMGEPILDGPKVPTTLAPTRDGSVVVEAPLSVAGRSWAMTCVSMGNPHAVTYSVDGKPIKVGGGVGAGVRGWGLGGKTQAVCSGRAQALQHTVNPPAAAPARAPPR
jgi:hypothetical protein